ncbi:MAG: cupin domain-containing protein [Lewinellaceae bacterium]|nr:cupin domain-containing protein [Saprospiraceae bacterium]MCB9332706.1 cupin domain-containing protein [Lewinellaceae bacterium]
MIYKTDIQKEFYTEERCFITEILNSADIPQLSVAQARVEPGVTTALHSLNADESYYILEGHGQVEIGGGSPQSVEKGDLVRIPTGRSQRITNTGEGTLIFLCICTPRFTAEGYSALD